MFPVSILCLHDYHEPMHRQLVAMGAMTGGVARRRTIDVALYRGLFREVAKIAARLLLFLLSFVFRA